MTFWIPEAVEHNRYRLRASQSGCVGVPGRYAMMGGVTTGAVITAMEHYTGRQLLWSSSQFVAHAPAETDFDIELRIVAEGARLTQAQGTLLDGDRVVVSTMAALGELSGEPSIQCGKPQAMRLPQECPPKESDGIGVAGDLLDQFERRVADQSDEAAFEALWLRPKDNRECGSGLLAVLGDFLPGATSMTRGASSVDNTLRVHGVESSEWFLAESRLEAVRGRIYHGTMSLFSESGTLLAVASQTGVRPR